MIVKRVYMEILEKISYEKNLRVISKYCKKNAKDAIKDVLKDLKKNITQKHENDKILCRAIFDKKSREIYCRAALWEIMRRLKEDT
jgi:hypothetical protein